MIPFLIVIHFFLGFSLLPFILTDEKPKYGETCEPFDCGTLGKVSAPFSNITHPECGLFSINCTEETPTIDFKQGGRSYDVISIFANYTILIHDPLLQIQLDSIRKQQTDSKNCNLLKNISLPASPILSFELSNPSLTLFECKFDPNISRYDSNEISTYEVCKDESVIYYSSYPEQFNSSLLPQSYVPYCSVVQISLLEPPPRSQDWKNDLFSLLSAEYSLEWNISPEGQNCVNDGGLCRTNSTHPFLCNKWENDRKGNVQNKDAIDKKANIPRKIVIGVGAAAGASLLTIILVFFLFRRWRRKNKFDTSSTLISRSISPDLSMKPDHEKGSTYFQTPIFNYKELEEATNNFDSNKELGDGGFGTVYHGELRDGRVVAVKRLYENNCKRVEQFLNEVTILSLLRHQNLVTLYGCTSRHSRELLLVYEYVPNGTVADHLHGDQAKSGLLTWPIRMSIAIESAGALAYLHASDIIHRDVKTNNILLDINFHVKVADFGLSRLFPTDVTHVSTAPQGTPGYVDPEYYQCYQLTEKSDVYSFGVVLIELISSMPAVDINRHRHEINLSNMAINKIHNHALHELVDSSLGFEKDSGVRRMITLVAELAFRCLQQEREMRPTMAEVVEVLKGIVSEGTKVVKGVEVDIPAEDVRLLKNIQPLSPDSVTDKWVSKFSTTPNTVKVVKGVELDIPAEDVRLLKKIQPLSPDSVSDQWVSSYSTTPNTSS